MPTFLSLFQQRDHSSAELILNLNIPESESDDSEAQESGEDESNNDCEVIGGKEPATVIAHLATQTVNALRQRDRG